MVKNFALQALEWVAEINPGIRDEEVIALAKQKEKVLITKTKTLVNGYLRIRYAA